MTVTLNLQVLDGMEPGCINYLIVSRIRLYLFLYVIDNMNFTSSK